MFDKRFSVIHAMELFMAVLLVGTFWRLVSLHLVSSSDPKMVNIGKAMTFQY